MSAHLISISIFNFRGIVSFSASPDGKSLTLRGRNGSGKSAAIDALWWALGGKLDGEVVNNAADRAVVEVDFAGYQIRRAQTRGKAASLTVKDGEGRTYSSPAALLAGFVGAVERQGFTARKPKEQAEILRRLAPGLDCGDLDAERARIYEERTGINRDAKALRAQADGVQIPEAPAEIGEERAIADVVDVGELAARKVEAAQRKAENDRQRAAAKEVHAVAEQKERAALDAVRAVRLAEQALEDARRAAEQAERDRAAACLEADAAEQTAAALIDPDTTAIDAEIAGAKARNQAARAEAEAHNRAVRAAQQQQAERARAEAERKRLADRAAFEEDRAAAITARIDAIDEEKRARIAAAALPIPGLALSGDLVTYDDGTHGPVEVAILNTASRARLDIVIAAALGHRLVAVRDASLLDADTLAEVQAFAASHDVQLISEVVASGEPLTAVIEEAAEVDEL